MNELLSTNEVAAILKVSRQSILKKIKNRSIKALKVGRNYVIAREEVLKALGLMIGEENKKMINNAIKKATGEYKEAFKKLGRE